MTGKEWVLKAKERICKFGIKEWVTVLVVGVCLLVLVIPADGKKKTDKMTDNITPTPMLSREESYTEVMEKRVEELLSQVESVGRVKVMITVKTTEEKNVLKDGPRELKESTEQDSAGGSRISYSEVTENETVFSGEEPYLLSESYPEVIGVVVLAEGSGTGSVDYDFSTRRASSKAYGNAKRYLMYSLWGLEEYSSSVAIAHPGIAVTNITAHFPKPLYALMKYPMKLIFMKPRKACLSILLALFEDTEQNEWIGPRVFDVWGLPKKKKLKTCSKEEAEQISKIAKEIYLK